MLKKVPPPEPPIPVQFFSAPGVRAKAPGKNPLPSDMNRVAHGGDPKLPKMEVPKAVPKPGIRDMDPGRRGESAPPPRGAQAPQGDANGVPPRPEAPTDAFAQSRPKGAEGMSPVQPLKGISQPVLEGLTAEQVSHAARNAGESGDEGGGYEREGGFVDSGPLSFDTVGYDWGAYAAEMIRKIKHNWDIPQLAQYGIKGKLTIRFYILKDGRVEAERVLAGSGTPPFDNAAFQAIARSSAFKPLPADLGKDREGVTITFFYNIRPEDEALPLKPKRPRTNGSPP
jgi:TonB family protein